VLYPLGGIPVTEYDVTCTISPTSRLAHHSDTALVSTELVVRNDTGDTIRFPFLVLTTDSGQGAGDPASVAPKVINGSRAVELDEVNEQEAARLAGERVAALGGDPAIQAKATRWVQEALARAERTRIGRTTIKPGESRRIVVQQRLRIQPDANGNFQFVTIAPTPLFTVTVRGRVSVYVLLPFEDDDVRIAPVPELTEQSYGYELTTIKQRKVVSWYWQNDPILKLGYRYA
jgi:hypothetical protein